MIAPCGSTENNRREQGDAELAELAAELGERLRRGEAVDLADYDDRVDQLRELLPTIEMMTKLPFPATPIASLGCLGDFRIVREVGRGGMGVVYEAVQVSLDRRVALKVLPNAAVLSPRHLRRFQVEAQAAASLHHPHIVPVFATGSADGIPFYAMQFIDGCDLARILRELRDGGDTDIPRAADLETSSLASFSSLDCSFAVSAAKIARQAALALEHAHSNDVLHRDIKPSNLLIDETGQLWITDFGLARIRGNLDLTNTGDALGTPRYMSPEQAQTTRTPLDGRTDIYSVGATLYELLTLRPAFPGDDRLDVLRRIIEQEPTPPRKINPTIPVDLETIVLKAMAKARADRYATAADLAADLGRFLDNRPISARRANLVDRAAKWTRRHRRLVAGTAAWMFLLALGLAAAMFQYTVWLRHHSALLEAEVARADRNAAEAERHRLMADRHLHGAQIRLACQALEDGQVERAQDLLHDDDPSLGSKSSSDFAWQFLWRRATREIVPMYGHERNLIALAISPDGQTLASGDDVGLIRLWDLRDGFPLPTLKGHSQSIRRLVFSADGRLLTSVGQTDGHAGTEVVLWEVTKGRELASIGVPEAWSQVLPVFLAHESALRLSMWSRGLVDDNGRESATTEIRTYDITTQPGQLRQRAVSRCRDYSCLTPAGQIVTFVARPQSGPDCFTIPDDEVSHAEWVFDPIETGKILQTAFTPDGRIVAAAFGMKVVSCRDMKTGAELLRYTSESPVRELALSADGRTLAAACQSGIVELRSLTTDRRTLIAVSAAPRKEVTARMAFSPDGTKLATSEWGIPGGTTPLTIWDVATGRRLAQYPGRRDFVQALIFAPDSRSLLITAGPTIRRWQVERAVLEPSPAGHDDEAWAVAFSLDSRLLASGSDDTGEPETIRIWDPKTGRKLLGWYAGVGSTAALAFSPDGHLLASAHLQLTDNIRLWEAATGKLLATLSGHTGRARTVAFHPNGKLFVSAGSDRTIRFWDVSNQRQSRVLNGHDDTIQQVVFSPDGARLVSASSDDTVRSWDVAQGRLRWTFKGPEKFAAVEYSPDGLTLAAADEDGSITLIDPESGAQRGFIRDEERVLRNLAFTPDGRILAAAGETGRVRFWDPLTGQELLALADNASVVHTITFAPDGSAMAFASHNGAVTIWRAGRDKFDAPQLSLQPIKR